MNKKELIVILIGIGIIGIFVIFNKEEKNAEIENLLKCPEEMQSFEEYATNRAEIMSLVYEKNKNMSQEEATTIIIEMAEKKGCNNDVDYLKEYKQSVNGNEAELNLISDDDLNSQNLLEYDSGLGFSFKYPEYTDVKKISDGNNWIIISPKGNDDRKIVISLGDNSENLKAEEWFLGPDSGFDPKKEVFFRTKIDGQDAVYTDAGAWLVVNSPDNKYRLSIAELTMENEEVMYKEMGIVFKTLKFR